jgi:tRNA A37 threonylcarbamoyladenosine modification protein TsaB
LKIAPVSTFDALAWHAASDNPTAAAIAVWVDAQRGEVYSTVFDPEAGQAIEPARAATPEATVRAWHDTLGSRDLIFAGDGAIRYRDVIARTFGERARVLDAVPHLAPLVARIAARDPSRAVLPHAVVPIYVRRSDAELARDRGQVPDSQNATT